MDAQKLWAGLGFAALLLLTWAMVALTFRSLTQFWITGALGMVAIGAALTLAWIRAHHTTARLHLKDPNFRSP